MRTKNKFIDHLCYFSLGLISIFSCSFQTENIDFTGIEEIMSSAIKDSVFPGAVLSFGNQEGVLFHKAFGHFTYDSGSTTISKGSLFDLASVRNRSVFFENSRSWLGTELPALLT